MPYKIGANVKMNFLKLLFTMKKGFPQSQLVYYLILILKVFPLFIFTHDWNIISGKGISAYLMQLTLCPFIFSFNNNVITGIIVVIILIFTLLLIGSVLFALKNVNKYGVLLSTTKSWLYVTSQLSFYIQFVFNQYFYAVVIENYFCRGVYADNSSNQEPLIIAYDENVNNCRNPFNYVVMCIQTLLFVYYLCISYLVTILAFEPYFTSDKIIVNHLNNGNIKWVLFPLIQGILQLEYHIPLSIMIYIKSIVRGMFILFYIKHIFYESTNFYTRNRVYYCKNFVFSMCAISCVIEYGFLFDYDNHFMMLQNNILIVIFKLLSECLLAGLIMRFVELFEVKMLSNFIETTSHNQKKHYDFFNKYFYYIYRADEENFSQLGKMVKNFFNIFTEHKKLGKCNKVDTFQCYCENYTKEDIFRQSNSFMSKMNKNRTALQTNPKQFKNSFPVFYKFLENFFLTSLEKYKSSQNIAYGYYLLILVVFYMVFDKNFHRSLFFIEEVTKTSMYKNSFIIKIQVKLLKIKLMKDYKNSLLLKDPKKEISVHLQTEINPTGFPQMHKAYKNLIKYIYMEDCLKTTLQSYLNLLNKLNESEVKFEAFLELLKCILNSIHINNDILAYYFLNDKCTTLYSCSKLSLYYKFFFEEIPPLVKDCFIPITSYDNLITRETYSTLILKSFQGTNQVRFGIEYASDDLCDQLLYNIDELKLKEFFEISPKGMAKAYIYHLLKIIKKGKVKVQIKELCLLDKDSYAKLFDMTGIVLFSGDHLKIFAKIQTIKTHQKHIVNVTKNVASKKDLYKLNKNLQFQETCFLFANKLGNIKCISREFEKYFNLNIRLIKKLKVNIFKDILKVESTNHKESIKIPLLKIYEHIANLTMSQMFETNHDELAKAYKNNKDIMKKITSLNQKVNVVCEFEEKNLPKDDDHKQKELLFALFTVELENNFTAPLESFFGITFKDGKTKDYYKEIAEMSTFNIEKSREKMNLRDPIEIRLCEDTNDVLHKVRLVRNLSLQLLDYIYHIKKDSILNIKDNEDDDKVPSKQRKGQLNRNVISTEAKNFLETVTNSSTNTNSNSNMYSSTRKVQLNKNISRKIKCQLYIWISILLVFVFMLIFISRCKSSLFNDGKDSLQAFSFLLLSRNIMTSAFGSVLYLQFQTNGLQGELIDNDFPNDYLTHCSHLQSRIQDYLSYFKLFQMFYTSVRDSSFMIPINKIFYKEYPYIILGIDKKSAVINTTLWDTIYYLHLVLHSVKGRSNLIPLMFNMTDGDGNKYIYAKQVDMDIQFHNCDQSSVFLIENYLKSIKYPFDEIVNLFPDAIANESRYVRTLILSFNISISVFLMILFLAQSFVYHNIHNIIFAKYYINFNYLRYFNLFLLRKTLLMIDFVDNSIIKKIILLQSTRLGLVKREDENNCLAKAEDILENPLSFTVKPFLVKITITEPKKIQPQNSSQFNVPEDFSPAVRSFQKLISFNDEPTFTENGFLSCANNFNALIRQGEIVPQDNTPIPSGNLGLMKQVSMQIPLSTVGKPEEKKSPVKSSNNMASVINQTMNLTTNNLLEVNRSENGRKNQIKRPKSVFRNLVVFLGVSIIIFLSAMINFIITHFKFENLVESTYANQILLERIGYVNELLLIYQISVLKNEELIFEYHANENVGNDSPMHKIFEETAERYRYFRDGVSNFTNGNDRLSANHLIKYEGLVNSENFCEYYAKFYVENVRNFTYPVINSLKTSSYDTLVEKCTRMGKGFNSRGLATAIDSLFRSITSLHKDFISDNARNESSNYLRLNDNLLQTYQAEMDYLFDKLFVNYLLCLQDDFNEYQNLIDFYEALIQVFIILLLFLFALFYVWKFSITFTKEDDIIDEIGEVIYNTIVF